MISASQAIKIQKEKISTSNPTLDDALHGGIPCGRITELTGPPGSGKTRLAIAIASNARKFIWIDTKCTCPETMPGTFLFAPTLAHLLALFVKDQIQSQGTTLVVVDDISTPINATRRTGDTTLQVKTRACTQLFHAMARLAGLRNIAVLVLSQMTTTMQDGVAMLRSSLDGAWAELVTNRLTILRKIDHQSASDAQVLGEQRIVMYNAKAIPLELNQVKTLPREYVGESSNAKRKRHLDSQDSEALTN